MSNRQAAVCGGHNELAPDAPKQVFVVLNPVAGRVHAPELYEALERYFGDDPWSYKVYETTGEENIGAIVGSACERGAALVLAAGGDGTVADVANALVGTGIPLGILPFGTGNILARALGIPQALEPALELLTTEHRLQTLDVMQVGDRYFILNVSAGISARTMRDTSSAQKRRFGMAAYVWTGLRKLRSLRRARFRLVIDGQKLEMRAIEVLVTNGALLNESSFPLGPRETFTDGQLDIYVLTARGIADYLKLGWDLIVKRQKRAAGLQRLHMRDHMMIEVAGRALAVQADGEVIGQTPVEIRMVPAAIQIVTPKQGDH